MRRSAQTHGPAHRSVAGAKTSVAATLRRQRATRKIPCGVWVLLVIGIVALVTLIDFLVKAARTKRPEEHPHYKEALVILRNDGLSDTTLNVLHALRLMDAATEPYSDIGFWTVDPLDWPPRCHNGTRTCSDVRSYESQRNLSFHVPLLFGPRETGMSLSKLELEGDRAKVWLIEGLIDDYQRRVLFDKAKHLQYLASPTDHAEGQHWRSSSSALLSKDDPALQDVLEHAATLCGVPVDYVEPPQIVRYFRGESYRPHMDSEGPHHRHWTLLLYLNDLDGGGGGGTVFPLLGLRVLPAPGTAIFWENLRESETSNPTGLVRNYDSLHAGEAVSGSIPKYAMNIWIRNKKYQ
eukprot:TRINITY_DN50671_c0_g1_i1.p1 TRINITY_DN50671_c0_g1~~TRINITY_DN50671_c0_g1_i1.p1  ORF type:complete len:351 (-),score=27.29 TRINITY_DN50671_c0_g1_i1:106-1158(-)